MVKEGMGEDMVKEGMRGAELAVKGLWSKINFIQVAEILPITIILQHLL